jgi:hypothetical protein
MGSEVTYDRPTQGCDQKQPYFSRQGTAESGKEVPV